MKKTANTASKATKASETKAREASEIFAMLRGEVEMHQPVTKAKARATKAGEAKAKKALLTASKKGKSHITREAIEATKGATDFDKLVNLVTKYEGATATKKAVRFTLNGARFSCWRRVANIRIYTNHPELINIDWVADTHEAGLTHSGYTDFNTIANALVLEELAPATK